MAADAPDAQKARMLAPAAIPDTILLKALIHGTPFSFAERIKRAILRKVPYRSFRCPQHLIRLKQNRSKDKMLKIQKARISFERKTAYTFDLYLAGDTVAGVQVGLNSEPSPAPKILRRKPGAMADKGLMLRIGFVAEPLM